MTTMTDSRVSSFCSHGDCVSVTFSAGGWARVTDTKARGRALQPALYFSPAEWRAFVKGVKAGQFDGVGDPVRAVAR